MVITHQPTSANPGHIDIYYYQYYNKEWLVHSSGVHSSKVEGEALRA